MSSNFKLILTCLVFLFSEHVQSQSNLDYEEFFIGEETSKRSGIALSPDGKTVAIAGMGGSPLFIYDWKSGNILKQFDVAKWNFGAKVSYSEKGKYILLEEVNMNVRSLNKGQKVGFEIVLAANGEVIADFKDAYDVKISHDETFCVVLDEATVTFVELPSGNKTKKLTVDEIAYSIALSHDDKHLIVPQKIDKEIAKNIPSIRNDKKAIKSALKYRQVLVIYDVATLDKKTVINEAYDIVRGLKFSKNGEKLFCYSIPHTKMQTSTAGRQGYIYLLQMPEGDQLRASFVSLSPHGPDFKENKDNKLFGVESLDKVPQVNIHDYKTGKLLARFSPDKRLGESRSSKMFNGSMGSFVFLPDETILIITGNYAIKWNPDLKY